MSFFKLNWVFFLQNQKNWNLEKTINICWRWYFFGKMAFIHLNGILSKVKGRKIFRWWPAVLPFFPKIFYCKRAGSGFNLFQLINKKPKFIFCICNVFMPSMLSHEISGTVSYAFYFWKIFAKLLGISLYSVGSFEGELWCSKCHHTRSDDCDEWSWHSFPNSVQADISRSDHFHQL